MRITPFPHGRRLKPGEGFECTDVNPPALPNIVTESLWWLVLPLMAEFFPDAVLYDHMDSPVMVEVPYI